MKIIISKNKNSLKFRKIGLKKGFKIMGRLLLALVLILNQSQFFMAFEAHVINVTAHVCDYSEIRSMGYWKNHSNVYVPLLPQFLGDYPTDEVIGTIVKVDAIFDADNSSMRNKLKKQLLAMKFNIANFGIGGYVSASDTRSLDQIVADADNLLRQMPQPSKPVLEAMKNLLEGQNTLEQIKYCSTGGTGGPTPHIVINKVYYDVDTHHGVEWNLNSNQNNEWIEIYNPSDEAIDISGWIIEDNNSQDIIPSSPPIPAQGFAVISGRESTWQYWSIPPEAIKIVLGGDHKIGNALANNGDRVILKMPDGTEVDSMSYGSDTYAFNPAAPDVAEGHILGRNPNGLDTDDASDWYDFGVPEVTVNSPGCVSWGEGQNVNLEWTAHNPNGPDSDLSIDIIYITDNNNSGYPDTPATGDSNYLIADNIANTGELNWHVNPGYYGWVWIKVIATGPENFMMSNYDYSCGVWEPPEGVPLEVPSWAASTTREVPDPIMEGFEEEVIEETATSDEEIITEPIAGGSGGIAVSPEFINEEITSDTTEEILAVDEATTTEEATTTQEAVTTEEMTTEEATTSEEVIIEESEIATSTTANMTTTAETAVDLEEPVATQETPAEEEGMEETPSAGEQEVPVILPEDNSSIPETVVDGDGGNSGDVGGNPEGTGETAAGTATE